MSATATIAIPFESQSDPETRRDCGAACLSMVYRSFGKQVPPSEIWPGIAKPNRFGSVSSTTHLMAQDALNRGLAAVAIQARHPLQALRLCREFGIRAILNHRIRRDAPTGHYTVLADLDGKDVVLRDPFTGPSRRLSHAELLELWQPHLPCSEIAGYVLIAVAATRASAAAACEFCHTPMPSRVVCPRCKKPVGLQPSALLGCVNNDCIARMWNYVCCPSCDYTWTFSVQPPEAGVAVPTLPNELGSPGASSPPPPDAQAPPASKEDPLGLNRALAEIDKFCRYILAVPGAAAHPEVKKQLDFIASRKEKLKLAHVEALVHQRAHQEQLAKFTETAKRNAEVHRKKLEELNRPSPSLDGDALGRALLKNLGFTG